MMLTKQIDIIVSYLKSGPKGMQGKIMDVHLKELLHGSSVVFLSKGIAALAVYLFTYLVSTSYGATAMGSFALSITFLSIAATISKLGLGLSLLKHVSEHAANQNWSIVRGIYTRSVKLVVISGLLLSTFIYVLSPVITKVFYKDASFSSSIRIIALFIIPFSLIELHAESVRGLKNIREYAFLQREMIYLCAVLFLSLSIPFTRWPLTPLMTYLISIVVLSTLGTALWFRLSRITAYSPVYPYSYLSLIKDSIPIFISTASMQMMQWTGILLMGFYRNVSEVGIYNVVSRIAIVTSVILQAINSIAAPRLGELYTLKDMNNFRKMALHTSKLSFWYSFPVLIVIVLFPSQILNLFGDSFTPRGECTSLIVSWAICERCLRFSGVPADNDRASTHCPEQNAHSDADQYSDEHHAHTSFRGRWRSYCINDQSAVLEHQLGYLYKVKI